MTGKKYTDDELLRLIRNGDEQAFEFLYDTYATRLIAFAASKLNAPEEAKDIIHDLFVQLWQQRFDLSVTISLEAYLFSAVRYRMIDLIRKSAVKNKYLSILEKLPTGASSSEQVVNRKELESILQESVNALTPRLKEVFQLSRNEHLTIREIAARLKISEQTVKNQLSSALSQIRSRLSGRDLLTTLLIFFYIQ